MLKNASVSAPVVEGQELFLCCLRDRKHTLDPKTTHLSDLWLYYLKHFHCAWVWQVYFCLVAKSNVALPYVRFVHDLSF